MNLMPGSTVITADSAVGTSGAPTRVYCANLVSASGTAASVILKNGTSTSGTAYEQIDGIASKSTSKSYAGGLFFPGGCYADVTMNSGDYISIVYSTEI